MSVSAALPIVFGLGHVATFVPSLITASAGPNVREMFFLSERSESGVFRELTVKAIVEPESFCRYVTLLRHRIQHRRQTHLDANLFGNIIEAGIEYSERGSKR